MSRASVLAMGRNAAEAGMIDACVIRRATGEANDGNGGVVKAYATIYAGKCRIQQSSSGADRPETPGEAYLLMVARVLQLPVDDSAGVRADDEVTMTACVHDADLVGRAFVLRGEMAATEKTARRMAIEERTS